jgi:hypothetical protein
LPADLLSLTGVSLTVTKQREFIRDVVSQFLGAEYIDSGVGAHVLRLNDTHAICFRNVQEIVEVPKSVVLELLASADVARPE